MEAQTVEIVQQVFAIAAAAVASGWVTSALTQLLKWKAISIPAEKYPVPTALVISLLTSAGAVYMLNMVVLNTIIGYVIFAASTLLVATQSYDIARKAIEKIKEVR